MNLFSPVKWKKAPLGDLAAGPGAFVDGPFGSNLKASEYTSEGVPIVRIQNVRPNHFNSAAQKFITLEKADELKRHGYKPGDLIITKMGDPPGDACIVPDHVGSGIIVADVVRFRGDKCLIDHKYLSFYLNSKAGISEFLRLTRGSTRKRVNLTSMKGIEVPLPPVEEQRRIAAILDKADAIRCKRAESLALADELLKSAYIHMVGHRNPAYGDWKPETIEQLAEDKKGAIRSGPFGSALLHSEFVDEGIAVLGIDNAVQNHFAWGQRRFITEEKYEELRRYQVFPGDVIITIMGTTGRSAVIPDDVPEAITTKHLASITCDTSKILPEVLSFAIHSDPMIIRQIKQRNKGAIMDGLNLGIIRQLVLPRPPMELQVNFAEMLRRVSKKKRQMSSELGNGTQLFSSLSQRAFRGEL
ncbi:restriction endonuclease subunit S [Labrenzia sp. ac12]